MAAKGDSSSTEEDCSKFMRWGLGRGVNITKQTPWLEKTSFQVRAVAPESTMETDDGGLLKAYSEEVRSKTTVNSEVQAGIRPANIPVSVRMDVEYTRSALSAKYVVGTKIKTRTISFRVDFTDVAQSLVKSVEEAKVDIFKDKQIARPLGTVGKCATWPKLDSAGDESQEKTPRLLQIPKSEDATVDLQSTDTFAGSPDESAADKSNTPSIGPVVPYADEEERKRDMPTGRVVEEILTLPTGTSFEECLGSWIKDCLCRNGYKCHEVCNIKDVIHLPCMRDKKQEILNDIEKFLDYFVREFGVTHYVSAIELGALEYQELTLREFVHQAKISSKASVTAATYGGAKVSTTQRISRAMRSEKSQRKKIGVMNQDKVTEEAVIGCSFFPISNLIRMPYLQQALKNSIDKYVIEASKGGGPYHILFGDDLEPPRYITVDHKKSRTLTGTNKVEEAEGFMVKVFDNSTTHNHLEFSLTSSFPMYRKKQQQLEPEHSESQSSGDDTDTASSVDGGNGGAKHSRSLPLEYYLETRVNTLGRGSTLRMRMNSKLKNVRLLLKQRIDPRISCDTKQWRREREAYYIRCVHRPRNGYLCVKETEDAQGGKHYQVCIKPSVERHSDEGRVFMLFQLKRFL